MTQVGIGVLIQKMTGHPEAIEAINAAIGKRIAEVRMVPDGAEQWAEDSLIIYFGDNTAIRIYDNGQSCCEQRYMHTDDDLSAFVGAMLQGVDLRDGPTEEDDVGDPVECQFLLVITSLGIFTVVNYNAHNGYYGGFYVLVESI